MTQQGDVHLPEHKANVPEEKRELGRMLVLSGWLSWVFAALVLFYRIAEIRRGGSVLFVLCIALAALGIALMVAGRMVSGGRAKV